ncbi:methyltransferase family protein [Heliobacterium mobile]|uniref:methyltransferase family protein n=1 Tax=Heliobacterium mobile TaxID=28064 RepID=UPI002E25373C
MPVWLVIFSNLIVLLGYALIFWVFKVNRYASATIRTEAEQTVILSGPYAVVRHPMYTGGLLILLFTPMALGSYWALIPFAASIPVIVLRALNEEDVLLRELPGYREYCSKTRYRLLPMVW